MSGATIIIKDLYYRGILTGVNFSWRQGERLALLGTNGAGKSTLAKLLAGLMTPDSGEIKAINSDGSPLNLDAGERWRLIGLIGQHPRRQTVGTTVAEELSYGLLNLGLSGTAVKRTVGELLASLGLEGKENQSPHTLSGGERQRLVAAAILAMKPGFLILDEATGMLDLRAQERVMALLSANQGEMGQLLITHDLELAASADRVLLLESGQVRDLGKQSAMAGGAMPAFSHAASGRTSTERPTCSTPILEWRGTRYGAHLSLDAKVWPGEFIAVLGPSGAGKTTLLESASGLRRPDEGIVLVKGKELGKNHRHPQVRLLVQEAGEYLIGRTVAAEVFLGESKRPDAHELKKRQDYLHQFGLGQVLGAAPERLSGGERQKVALAALLRGPAEVLLLDEPLLGLDQSTRSAISRLIADLSATILYATHDLREVATVATRLWLIVGGRLVLDCPLRNWVYHRQTLLGAGVRCP